MMIAVLCWLLVCEFFLVTSSHFFLILTIFTLLQCQNAFFFRTSYDGATRQHWLSLSKGTLNCRFLLKDGRGGGGSTLQSSSLLPTSSSSRSLMTSNNPGCTISRHQQQHQVQQQQQQQPLSIMQKKQLGIKFATVQEEQDVMQGFIQQVVDRMIDTLNDYAATTTTTTATTSTTTKSSRSNSNSIYSIPNKNNNNNNNDKL
jgi:hypothetical protein